MLRSYSSIETAGSTPASIAFCEAMTGLVDSNMGQLVILQGKGTLLCQLAMHTLEPHTMDTLREAKLKEEKNSASEVFKKSVLPSIRHFTPICQYSLKASQQFYCSPRHFQVRM